MAKKKSNIGRKVTLDVDSVRVEGTIQSEPGNDNKIVVLVKTFDQKIKTVCVHKSAVKY